MLETELWLSFVSMLRSYAAAASLHSPEIDVASSENSVAITASDVRLEMQFVRSPARSPGKRAPRITAPVPAALSFSTTALC